MLYRALSLSFLLNTLLFAGDVPKPSHTVEMVNSNPAKPVPMPQVEFKHPHTGEGSGGGGNSSSGVGSTAGGSVINLLSDLLRVEQPNIEALRREKQVADFQASLQKYGEHTTAQFFPDLYEKYMRAKNPMPVAFAEPSYVVTAPKSIPVVTTAPAPVVTAPAPSSAAIVGKSPFTILNRDRVPTLNEITPPKNYIKPLPETPTAPSSSSSSKYSDAMAPAPSMPSGDWGQMIKDAGEGAAIVVGATVIVYGSYKIGEFLFNANKWALKKAYSELDRLGRKAFGNQPVHVPTPQPTVQSHSTPAQQSHQDIPARLQPSDNPVKLGKKIYQPGPLPGQGDNPHGYKDQFGHYKYYTPENVAHAIESVEKGVWHGQNPMTGKHLYSYDCPKTGLQKWAETDNNGEIMNCGINEVRHTFCPTKKKLMPPAGFKKPKGKDIGWVDKTLKAGAISTALSSQYSSTTPIFRPLEEENFLPSDHYFLPPAPHDITVHDLEAERRTKNHFVAMEQKKIEVIQNKINQGSNL
jgi:hypothetical protein